MTSIQPELWVDTPREAVTFYEAAFGANVVHQVGDGHDVVAQLAVGEAAFWVAGTSATMKRLSPRSIDGATSRTLLVIKDRQEWQQRMVPLWSPVVATGGNRSQIGRPSKGLKQAQTVAVGCDRSPCRAHGKGRVDATSLLLRGGHLPGSTKTRESQES